MSELPQSTGMKASKSYIFQIADLPVNITFNSQQANSLQLLPSFIPFLASDKTDTEDLLFRLEVDDNLKPVPKEQREHIRKFDTGNGNTIVDRLQNGGYQYIIKDINGYDCCLLITDKKFKNCRCALNGNYSMRCFGLNNALMLIFAFASSHRSTLLIHASLVRKNGYGYPFIAKSGTGKSTHVSLWLRHIPGCDLMNDDNPIIRFVDGTPFIYGSPWSGKTPCYRNTKARLGAITRIDRAKENSIEKLPTIEAFASVLPACSAMKWDPDIYNDICDTVGALIETTDIFTLHCLPDKEAALLCYNTIKK